MYYRYEVTLSAYVLTPGEKLILNAIVVFIFSLLSLATIAYLLPLIARVSEIFFWLYSGMNDDPMGNNATSIWAKLEPRY